MRYVSTSGNSPAATFRDSLFSGLAPDGGLYVPERLPEIPASLLKSFEDQSMHSIGREISALFIDDIPPQDLSAIVERAWTFPIPLVPLEENLHLLELFHGPTLAFKDVGARFMAQVLSYYLKKSEKEITILVATSGDTGSAVAQGFFEAPHITVCVLYPTGKISKLQEQQMATLGKNIRAFEVDGTFDDCQRMVKEALSDVDLVRKRNLTTANSMNLGRLIPQIVYYVWGLAQWSKKFSGTDKPTVVVPSGNFGNLTAAVYAKQMGAPIGKLIAATNVNDVVPQYLTSGEYKPRPSLQTYSNAMDVGNPSNLARLRTLFRDNLAELRKHISAISISDDETLAEIQKTYERTGIILDPHTAVGVSAARKSGGAGPVIIAATAHPGKFPEVIERAIGKKIPLPKQLVEAMKRGKVSVRVKADYNALREWLSHRK
ncbi:MAG: threonine synthase [Bacteroidota bacterium]